MINSERKNLFKKYSKTIFIALIIMGFLSSITISNFFKERLFIPRARGLCEFLKKDYYGLVYVSPEHKNKTFGTPKGVKCLDRNLQPNQSLYKLNAFSDNSAINSLSDFSFGLLEIILIMILPITISIMVEIRSSKKAKYETQRPSQN